MGYRGFGSDERVIIQGALQKTYSITNVRPENRRTSNFLNQIKRYLATPIPGATVCVHFSGMKKCVETNDNGIFMAVFDKVEKQIEPNASPWREYKLTLEHSPQQLEKDLDAPVCNKLLVPHQGQQFGVISDIDDTLLVSHSTEMIRKLKLMMLKNSYTRKPFPGVVAFYKALHKKDEGTAKNPFFYVSSSEWNLYEMLDEFCRYNEFPEGVFMLRDLQHSIFKFWKSGGGSHDHKIDKIRSILLTYNHIKFVLMGDSGQQDPDIYRRIIKDFPGRIKAVFIRKIKKKREFESEIIKDDHGNEIPFYYVKDSYEASKYALKHELITEDELNNILSDTEKEKERGAVEI